MVIAMNTSRASRKPLFTNSQIHRATQTIEIAIPNGVTNVSCVFATDRSRRRRIGNAAHPRVDWNTDLSGATANGVAQNGLGTERHEQVLLPQGT